VRGFFERGRHHESGESGEWKRERLGEIGGDWGRLGEIGRDWERLGEIGRDWEIVGFPDRIISWDSLDLPDSWCLQISSHIDDLNPIISAAFLIKIILPKIILPKILY